jgi:hypothetical protein
LIAQKLESSGAGIDTAEEHPIELSAAIDDAALGAAFSGHRRLGETV